MQILLTLWTNREHLLIMLPKWKLRKGLPGIPPAERGYRAFWWRKGDVFRLLMSLQNVLDGCTWPRQDARAVQQLQGFIHHVTGEGCSLSAQGKLCSLHVSCCFSTTDLLQAQGIMICALHRFCCVRVIDQRRADLSIKG